VAINSAFFIIFALSFFRPKSGRDWRTFGTFSAFIVALFVEMYGFPLTIYLLSGWLGQYFPQLSYGHGAGHLWYTLLGLNGDPHSSPIHGTSNILIYGGLILLVWSWRVLYRAQRTHTVATGGPYALVRHPQYVAFILVMLGFLVQWPTIPTLVMFPILVVVYARLANREEQDVRKELGPAYGRYAAKTPAFIPFVGRREAQAAG
jgi:protein-S-isoprenylcysteine O-methyltransferase Ste14